jgi:hypothetical protein
VCFYPVFSEMKFWVRTVLFCGLLSAIMKPVAGTQSVPTLTAHGSVRGFGILSESSEEDLSAVELLELDERISKAKYGYDEGRSLHDVASVDPSVPWDSFECSCEFDG